MDEIETRVSEMLHRGWTFLLLRGIAAIMFGILTLTRPGITLTALVLLFAVYAISDGVLAVLAAVSGRSNRHWWMLLLGGLIGIGVGVLALLNPGLTAIALLFYIAGWAIATGVLEVIIAIRVRKEVHGEWRLIVAGVVSIAFGAFLFARPGAGAVTVLGMIGFYALGLGLLLVMLAFKARSLGRRLADSDDASARVTHLLSVRTDADARERARSRSSCTSSSVVCAKSSYHSPTARNGSGVSAQMISSATSRKASHTTGADTGTATTMRCGASIRSAPMAARTEEPVARPSSTRITVLPKRLGRGRSLR